MSEFESLIGKEHLNPAPLFRDILVETTFKSGRAIHNDIDALDLGVFTEEARTFGNRCFMDPHNSNYVKNVFVTGKGKVLIPNNAFKGTELGVLMMVDAPTMDKKLIKEKKLDLRIPSMLIQTMSNQDAQFSMTGLTMLMQRDEIPFSLASLLMVGRTQNMVVFRGENTPQWTEEEASDRGKLWFWQLGERIRQFANPSMSLDEIRDVTLKSQGALMKQICEKYDLRYYSGSSEGSIVVKRSPNLNS